MKKFNEIDIAFKCINCGFEVKPLGYTSRDHCPKCLYALHVDINPGDRASACKGILKPIDFENFKGGYKIIYKCQKCEMIRKNVFAKDDDFDILVELSSNKK